MNPSAGSEHFSKPVVPRLPFVMKGVFLYAIPIAAVAAASAATYLLDHVAPERPNFFFFFAAITFSAWFAGTGPGWLSVILSTLSVDYFFLRPLLVLEFGMNDLPWLASFACFCIATNAISLQRRRWEADLLRMRDSLELQVRERTSDLQKSNESLVTAVANREEAEMALRINQNELAQVARHLTVGELTSTIAHEINQPLAAVVSNGEAALNWLRRDTPELAEVAQSIHAVLEAGHLAKNIICRMRGLLEREPVSLNRLAINAVVESVLDVNSPSLKSAHTIVERDFDLNLPPVLGDRVQLQQLLLNLLNNALEAMADTARDSRHLTIRTGLAANSVVTIRIEDNGSGFAEAAEKRLFEPFFTTKSNGIGIGLTICQTIVQLHRGKITASTRSPRGAIFQVDLPAEKIP